jgi:hypothetical protein
MSGSIALVGCTETSGHGLRGFALGLRRRSVDPDEVRPYEISEIGQLGLRVITLKQSAAEFTLQFLNRAREGGLLDAATPGGPCEALVFAEGEEIGDLMHFHGAVPCLSHGDFERPPKDR